MRRVFLYLLGVIAFSSCSQLQYFAIETHNPADVTFPDKVQKVLVVNNAVPQPPGSACRLTIDGVVQDSCRAEADSALFDARKALGEAMFDTDYFYDVILYNDPTRDDDLFLMDEKLTKEQVNDLCNETDADAVISFDRLLFKTDKDIQEYYDGSLEGNIKVQMDGTVRAYLPDRETPLATVLIEDSVYFWEDAPNYIVLNALLPDAEHVLRIAASYIGDKLHTAFVPYWNRDVRWYYSGSGTKWRRAASYAAKEKWAEALAIWQDLYDSSSGWKAQAKAAANIALSHELGGDFDQSLEWAEKAYGLYQEHAGKDNRYTLLQGTYKSVVISRIQSNKKLDLQLGDE